MNTNTWIFLLFLPVLYLNTLYDDNSFQAIYHHNHHGFVKRISRRVQYTPTADRYMSNKANAGYAGTVTIIAAEGLVSI